LLTLQHHAFCPAVSTGRCNTGFKFLCWCLISTLGTAGLVKSAAPPKVFRRNCKRMLRQQHGQTLMSGKSAQQTSMHLQRMTAIRPLLLITGTELFASFTIDWTMGGTEAVVSLRSGLRSGASPGFSGFAQ
jgi:hypothetical protein